MLKGARVNAIAVTACSIALYSPRKYQNRPKPIDRHTTDKRISRRIDAKNLFVFSNVFRKTSTPKDGICSEGITNPPKRRLVRLPKGGA
jgi:hypothetical protein